MKLDKIEIQEMADYNCAKNIIEKLFGKKLMGTDKLEQFSPVDMTFSACTLTQVNKYCLEIKSTPKRTYLTEGFILKVSKYISVMQWARQNGHKAFIIYLCTDLSTYYIFDLSSLTLSMDNLQLLNLKVRQYEQDSPMVQTAVIKLNAADAILSGEYEDSDGIDIEMLLANSKKQDIY